MPGIRLHHDTLKAAYGATLTYVVEVGKPYHRGHYDCPDCGKTHQNKAVHLRLDHQGDVIVAKPLWTRHRARFELAGMKAENEVAKPPPQFMGAVDLAKREVVEFPLNLDQAPAPAVRPSKTKYEGRDAMVTALEQVDKVLKQRKPRKTNTKGIDRG